ncbi:hypothetical protein [Shumkonia mesophila]|uniref:hypothetical protein n=1 Tax=Shumkonia mesophila TaxID=2838854 RepID=UPI002934D58F|nr:hypothetical protein [Shumkonia mesophila]
MTDVRSWPVGLRRLAEIIGAAAAVALAEAFGGEEDWYIPKTAAVDHPFVAVIGLDRMEALSAAMGGTTIEIPRGVFRDLKKARILQATGTSREIARGVGATQRYVRLVRNSLTDDGQPGLFDPPPKDD